MSDSVLKPFAEKVAARGRYGFDWASIISIILPMILECFQGPQQLADAAKGLTLMQRAGLRLRVRKQVAVLEQEDRVKLRAFQRTAAIHDVAEAIESELKATANSDLMQGDIFGAAFEEALQLGGA